MTTVSCTAGNRRLLHFLFLRFHLCVAFAVIVIMVKLYVPLVCLFRLIEKEFSFFREKFFFSFVHDAYASVVYFPFRPVKRRARNAFDNIIAQSSLHEKSQLVWRRFGVVRTKGTKIEHSCTIDTRL